MSKMFSERSGRIDKTIDQPAHANMPPTTPSPTTPSPTTPSPTTPSPTDVFPSSSERDDKQIGSDLWWKAQVADLLPPDLINHVLPLRVLERAVTAAHTKGHAEVLGRQDLISLDAGQSPSARRWQLGLAWAHHCLTTALDKARATPQAKPGHLSSQQKADCVRRGAGILLMPDALLNALGNQNGTTVSQGSLAAVMGVPEVELRHRLTDRVFTEGVPRRRVRP